MSKTQREWKCVDEELPTIEENEFDIIQVLGLFWEEDQEELFDDDDTKYDENGLILDIVYYYGNGIWRNNRWEKVWVKYWMEIPPLPKEINSKKVKNNE